MSSEERKVLNDRLAHLEDTLSDYDRSAIRAGAATALKLTSSYLGETLHTDGHCDVRAQAVTEFLR